ncbi:ATP-grasp domain-containing protein [Streptomyces glebosus]|nr:ATP-grasp domain-containing protein [Streptomyces glebosus]
MSERSERVMGGARRRADVPRYLVLNRFDDEFGAYHRYLSDQSCALAYLTLADCVDVLDRDSALDTVVVPDLTLETVLPHARELHARHGGFQGVVGLSEYDVLTAARLRDELGVPGAPAALVRTFRDKPLMKRAVAAAGLRVPRFTELTADTTAQEVARATGFPLVLKPRSGAASHGVRVLEDLAQLQLVLDTLNPSERGGQQCEEYVQGDVLHVDGVRRAGRYHFVSASAYVNTCLDFAQGGRLGSYLLDDGPLRRRVIAFAAACLDALKLDDGAFHLELLRRADGELVFLEVGMRPGGARIPELHQELFGVDLMGEALRAALGLPPMAGPMDFQPPHGGGWVLVPEPPPLPSRVVSRTPLRGVVAEVYTETVPEVGDVFDGQGGYLRVGGSFRLRGAGQAEVRRAVLAVMERYEVTAEPAGVGD